MPRSPLLPLFSDFLNILSRAADAAAYQLEQDIRQGRIPGLLDPTALPQNQARTRRKGQTQGSGGSKQKKGSQAPPRPPEPPPPGPTMQGFTALDTAYAVLGVGKDWDRTRTRKHYLLLISSPGVAVDRGGDPVRAAMINAAYQEVCGARGWKK